MEQQTAQKEFSLIIPVFNEEQILPLLCKKLAEELDSWVAGEWEVIFVDDGSSDRTFQLILQQQEKDPRFKAVMLSRNFGHQAAVSVGLNYADAKYTGVIDADLQDPLPVLQKLYEASTRSGANVAFGVRHERDAPWLLSLSYKIFYRFMGLFSDHPWPVDAGDFCVIDRRAILILRSMPETSRILRGLRSWIGLRQMAIPYVRPRRQAGRSKYNLVRLIRLALDSIVSFTSAPLQFAVICGFSTGLICLFISLLFLLNRLFPSFTIFGYSIGASPGTATIAILLSLVSAMNFFCLGIVGQYLAVILKEVKRRPQAIVQQTVGDLKAIDAIN
jgi:glycosyltransferase involved in cell wall biosynthesis